MDDFLHNLRSGKLKQPDRSNRSYNDQQYKGGQRRPMVDRRKRDYDGKETFERMGAIKEVLDNLADTQKRIADAMDARNKTETRKARAMEVLAKNIYQMLNPKADNTDSLFAPEVSADQDPSPAIAMETRATQHKNGISEVADPPLEAGTNAAGKQAKPDTKKVAVAETKIPKNNQKKGKLTDIDQQTLVPLIGKLREKGQSWERIARQISEQGYPTLSGKGLWRGVMVKNLYEKLTQ